MPGDFYPFLDKDNIIFLKPQLQKIKAIFWDTGFIINLLDDNNRNQRTMACKRLYNDILTDDEVNILNVSCDFVIEEAINYVIQSYYEAEIEKYKQEHHIEKNIKWTRLYKENPLIIQDALPTIKRIYEIMQRTPLFIHRPESDIDKEVYKLISIYNLCAMDAYIYATMKDAEINDILTMDVKDWNRLREAHIINIYSCNCIDKILK